VVDDVASTLYSTLDPVSFTLTPDLTEAQRGELAVEAEFYGLRDRMMPSMVHYEQDQIAVRLLKHACFTGTKYALKSAVSAARALVFEMGSTTPWLTDEFQDVQYVITDYVVNGAPVWAAENGEWFMFRAGDDTMKISNKKNCAAGKAVGVIYNMVETPKVLAPTQLRSNKWSSHKAATLGPQFTSAPQYDSNNGIQAIWVDVPDMRITAVHGLDDAEPAMAAALRQLTALTGAE